MGAPFRRVSADAVETAEWGRGRGGGGAGQKGECVLGFGTSWRTGDRAARRVRGLGAGWSPHRNPPGGQGLGQALWVRAAGRGVGSQWALPAHI